MAKRKEYTVKWEIELDATSKKDAARQALQLLRSKDSTAVVFGVKLFNNTNDEFEDFDLEEDDNGKSEKIDYIKKVIGDWGATSCCELERDHSPSMMSLAGGEVAELVEQFNANGVETVVYSGELEIAWNNYKYEELSEEVLDEIVQIMEDYEAIQLKTEKRCAN
jgi:hypothetical protein